MSKDLDTLQPTGPVAIDTPEPPAQLAMLARDLIVRSRSNPRTHFEPAYINELSASIRAHGLLQPILVRPLPADRLQDTFTDRQPGSPLPTHEIVCGECRWRACGAAGVEQIPVLIRILSDIQVLQVQLVENLRRKDLHPLEEAEGFERLMKDHGMTVEEIAAKVDKSVSQIYVTLKLLELTADCRKELYAGKLTRSTALLVARAPAHLQAAIAKDIMKPDFEGDTMSYRKAVQHIQQHYMLQLSTAVFDIQDAKLVAKAGDCKACPKRTGFHADLFEDVKSADTCTDPKCFDAKKVAHYAQVAKAAEAKGQKVIQGKEAKELMPFDGSTPKGYRLLDGKDYIEGRYTSVRSAIGKGNVPTPVIIINPHTHVAQEALPIEVANKLLKQAGAKGKTAKQDKAGEPSEHELKQQYESKWRANAVRQIFTKVTSGKGEAFGVEVAREIALYFCQDLYAEEAKLVAELLGLGEIGKVNAIETHIKECPAEQVAPAVLLMALSKDLEATYYNAAGTPFIDVLARDTGVDLAAVQDQVKADMREAANARKTAAEEKAGKVKKPEGKGKAKKTSAVDAKAAISQAMQDEPASANDFAVGQRVRFKMDLKGHDGKARKVCGREGTIRSKVGDRAWSVMYGERAHERTNADYTELEHVDAATASGDDDLASGAIELADGVKLSPQPAWPFPTDQKPSIEDVTRPLHSPRGKAKSIEPAANPAAAAWPFASTPKKPRKSAAA
jgi:ParB/RepB/Spo0J family partition protein